MKLTVENKDTGEIMFAWDGALEDAPNVTMVFGEEGDEQRPTVTYKPSEFKMLEK